MLDDLHVQPRQTKAVQDVALAFVGMLGPHDRLAIVNTSPHELVMQLSTDRDKAESLIRKFRGQMGSGGSVQSRDVATRIHLQVMRDVALALKGSASERRAVLVISEGQAIEPPGDGRMNEADARIRDDFRDVLRQAALANVATYGVNPTGLDIRSTPIATSHLDSANAAAAQAEAARVAQDRTKRRFGSVGQLADSTGGIMTLDRNSLEANLPRLLQDSRRYYRLAYVQPDVASGDRDKERRIEVKVLRERVEVRARKTYLPS
jgi:VWFA-related protein